MMNSTTIKNYLIAFLTTVDGGVQWDLNLAATGTWRAGQGWIAGNYEALKNLWQQLQTQGSNVIVSFGGATFNPGSSINEATVDELAKAIAYSFLGSSTAPSPSGPYASWKPVFTDFTFDGIDLDLEQSAGAAASNAVWLALAKSIKQYAPSAKITGAPQSPYLYNTNVESPYGVPFPMGAEDRCGSIPPPAQGDFLLSGSNIHLFDSLNVQFYNQFAALDFPTEKNFNTRICQLVQLIKAGSGNPTTKIYVGVVSPDGTTGQNGNTGCMTCNNPQDVGRAILAALNDAGGSPSSPWFGGVMGWQSPQTTAFVQEILQTVGGGNAAMYGYQGGNPNWG